MNRTEFLDTLRSQLSGQMHEGNVAAHVRYYLGVSAGVPVILASVDGCVVRSMTSTSDKVTLILPSLKGVFVLKAGDRSVKIMF